MKTWSVRGRIITALLFVITVMAAVSVYALIHLSSIQARATDLDSDDFPGQKAMGRLKSALLFDSTLVLQRVHSDDRSEEARLDVEMAGDSRNIRSLLEDYRLTVNTTRDRELYEALRRSSAQYFIVLDQIIKLDNDGESSEAYVIFQSRLRPILNEFLEVINVTLAAETNDSMESIRQIKLAASTSKSATLLGAGFAIVISLAVGFFLAGAIQTAQKAIRDSESRFRSLAEANLIGVCFADLAGNITSANDAFLSMVRYSREDLAARTMRWDTMTPPEYRDLDESAAADLRLHGRAVPFEKEYIAADGSRVPVLIGLAMVGGSINDCFALVIDLTERKRMERDLRRSQKMESIGTLAGGIAHDFNNILGAILGYAELAEGDLPDHCTSRAYLTEILKASNRAKDLVSQILTFSRQDEKHYRLIQLEPIVDEALKLLRASLPAAIEIRQELDSNAGNVLANSTEIHQVVMNLGTNAMYAMREGGGVLSVQLAQTHIDTEFAATHSGLHEGSYVCLTISDSGPGIDRAAADRVFDPFFTTKPPGEGTGLGLSTVHGIVKECGGVISLYSEPGMGATFNVYFPAHEGPVPKARAEVTPVPRGNGERILLVDDEEPLVNMNRDILERLGYEVMTCTNSLEALDRVRAGAPPIDLMITDFGMPGMNGADLARASIEARPTFPVIMATGYAGSMNPDSARSIGIREVIMKPTTSRSLGEAIGRVLKQRGEHIND